MSRRWSFREYEIARELMKTGCPLEIPWGPRGEPRFEITPKTGSLNEVIDVGLFQTAYALELIIANNLPGEFVIDYVGLRLPWTTTAIDWYDDPTDCEKFPHLRCLSRRDHLITEKDLLKLPCRMRRGKVLRGVLIGSSTDGIPEEFLHVHHVPAKVIAMNYWGEQHSGPVDLIVSQTQAPRLARQALERREVKPRRSILEERDPPASSVDVAGKPTDGVLRKAS